MKHRVPAGSFERISSVEGLWRAYRVYRKGKSRRRAVAAFDLDADRHIFELHRRLCQGIYQPGRFRLHVIRDPKVRLIAAAPVIDRVLHQALVSEIGPWFERSFIEQQYAGRTGKGPHRAVIRYLAWMRRHQWHLDLDISQYFPSIEHEILCGIIFRRLADPRTRALVESLVRVGGEVYSTEAARSILPGLWRPGRGVPVGSYLSQWAGALYLDGLDHFVKRTLKVRAYLRFMDDFTLFGDDREALSEARDAIGAWLAEHRRLALNPKTGDVLPCRQPSTYLGFRVSRAGLSPSSKMKKRMRRKVRAAAARGPDALVKTLTSYRGLLSL